MILITGGSGSGKSEYAESLFSEIKNTEKYYIATMKPFGKEAKERIQKHRRMRSGKGFITLEYPTDIKESLDVMDEKDIRMAFADPGVMVGSDGLIDNGHGHPRAAGTFPRFLAEFVRKGDISLYDGIEKMTAVPAKRLGLSHKGRLNVGADADVVIFDLEKIKDGATFDDPMIPPTGIDYVFIGGEIAAKDCKIVKGDLGTALRKLS